MSLRVVLYAEGRGDDRGTAAWLPEPGEPLPADCLGPAHLLMARVIERTRRIPARAVQFLSPLRILGRTHRGSDLLLKKNLRRLLTFASPARTPQLGVILVDEDGDPGRRRQLIADTEGLPLPRVIAVAVREFESWRIADSAALAKVLAITDTQRSPENMRAGDAKELLARWIATATSSPSDRHGLRLDLARTASLDALAELRAFAAFLADIANAPLAVDR
ncbi:MAG: hypothetical protein IPK26_26460 [Planctomycetes bacterium]|nr:hypothetical protein [Planctomycetota bacterium]